MPAVAPSPRHGSLPAHDTGPGNGPLPALGGAGHDGAAGSRAHIRRVRFWLCLLLLAPICLAGASLLVLDSNGPAAEPVVAPVTVPGGYRAVTDAYYGYAVPAGYRLNGAWSDPNGDFYYSNRSGWVAETLLVTKTRPTGATRPPPSFAVFSEPAPTPYQVGPGHRIEVPGTTFAWEEPITRPGGFQAVAVDTWLQGSSTQMWLLVDAPPSVRATVLASLRGG